MQEITEYTYYDGSLTITIATPRLDSTKPSTVMAAATVHEEFAAQIRSYLREYRLYLNPSTSFDTHLPSSGGFPLYGVRKIQPAGTSREVDGEFMIEITRLRFAIGFSILPTTFLANEKLALAFERNMEKAVKDFLDANSVPTLTIPGDMQILGDSWIDIVFEAGPATEQGLINVS